ncbi:MAG: lysylphosphatidylglycerol synthase domain-containing protein [Gaiellaceae bacterium]
MPSLKRLLNILFVLLAAGVAALVARHFRHAGWPLHHANFWLVALASLVMLAAYVIKAWGWQRLFKQEQRPAVLTLAAAGGAASVGGIALPGRCDEVIRVAVVRRCRRRRASFGAVALSIFLLGLLDSAALTPLASVAIAVAHVDGWLHAGLIVVAVAGVLSAAFVIALPRLARLDVSARFRLGRWVGENSTPPREAAWAWGAVAVSWTLRALAVFVLLAALGLGTDFALALAFVCAASASAVLPVAPAGAAMQAGAGAAILVASGIHAEEAVAFGIAAQAMLMGTGAVFVAALGAWHAQGRLQRVADAGALRRPHTLG